MAKHRLHNFGFSEELIRYGFVATSSFTVDLLTLHILFRIFQQDYLLSVAIGFVVGAVWNYLWAVTWAFAYRRLENRTAEIATYAAIAIIGFFANLIIMERLRDFGVTQLVEARMISAVLIAGISFGSKKLLLFTDYHIVNEIYYWYRKAPVRDRLHIIGRRLLLPLALVLRQIPLSARDVLEVGTGHGLILLTLANRRREQNMHLYGFDIDKRKIGIARKAAELAKTPIIFKVDDALPKHRKWDAIIIADVLYLLDATEQQAMLDSCLASLRPGGVLVIKGTAHTPRWKYRLAAWQERVAVHRLKITMWRGKGGLRYPDLTIIAEKLAAVGYKTQLIRADKGRLYPHLLLCVK